MLTCSWSCSASRGNSSSGRPSPLLRSGVELARDDETLDLAGAFIDLGDLRVAKQFLDREVSHVAVPADGAPPPPGSRRPAGPRRAPPSRTRTPSPRLPAGAVPGAAVPRT